MLCKFRIREDLFTELQSISILFMFITSQDPLEKRVLLGREAHGRHRSGSSRGSRHHPARSVCLSDRLRCLATSAPNTPIRRHHQASGVAASPYPDTSFFSLSFFLSHLTLPPPPSPHGSPSAVHVVTEQTDRGSQNGGRGGLSHPGHAS